MDSLWIGSDVDLSVLHKCRMAERLEYRLTCLHKSKALKSCRSADKVCADTEEEKVTSEEVEERFRRRRRSGTWP